MPKTSLGRKKLVARSRIVVYTAHKLAATTARTVGPPAITRSHQISPTVAVTSPCGTGRLVALLRACQFLGWASIG